MNGKNRKVMSAFIQDAKTGAVDLREKIADKRIDKKEWEEFDID